MIPPAIRTAAKSMAAAAPLHRLLLRFHSTARGAAAQPQLDSDYYYYYYNSNNSSEGSYERLGSGSETDGAGPRKGVQWVFIGCPLAKKRVYAETLSKVLEVPYISMASLVRQELNPRSSLYKQIAKAVNHGEAVPEDIIFGLLSKRLEDGYYEGETGFILDGIPRSQFQAEILDQLVEIDLVVNFKCAEDHLIKYQQRSPWKGKVEAYFEQSKPLEDYYQKQKKLIQFQVGSASRETWQGLLAALHLQYINATYSSNDPATPSCFL